MSFLFSRHRGKNRTGKMSFLFRMGFFLSTFHACKTEKDISTENPSAQTDASEFEGHQKGVVFRSHSGNSVVTRKSCVVFRSHSGNSVVNRETLHDYW